MNETDNFVLVAKMEWMAVFGRFFLNITNLHSFTGIAAHSFHGKANDIRRSCRIAAREAANNPLFKEAFENSMMGKSNKWRNELSDAFARRSIRLAQQTADSAALVFAHSMLDGLLSECCSICCKARPEDWLPFVQDKKVPLTDLRVRETATIEREAAASFVRQLQRESMAKKFDYLHKVCAPRLKNVQLATAGIKAEKLKAFDDLRHKIIHGRSFSKKTFNVEEQLSFAVGAGLSVLVLVNQAHKFMAENGEQMDFPGVERRMLRLCVVLRNEFPELLEVIERTSQNPKRSSPVGRLLASFGPKRNEK